jgi:hypothetical protein
MLLVNSWYSKSESRSYSYPRYTSHPNLYCTPLRSQKNKTKAFPSLQCGLTPICFPQHAKYASRYINQVSYIINSEKEFPTRHVVVFLGHIVLGTLTSLRHLPVDVLVRSLDVACLAVDAAIAVLATMPSIQN